MINIKSLFYYGVLFYLIFCIFVFIVYINSSFPFNILSIMLLSTITALIIWETYHIIKKIKNGIKTIYEESHADPEFHPIFQLLIKYKKNKQRIFEFIVNMYIMKRIHGIYFIILIGVSVLSIIIGGFVSIMSLSIILGYIYFERFRTTKIDQFIQLHEKDK